ncbi:MAG TPA: nucleoside hydrolase [Candidatus Limnocylindrales bacterium]|nr:nucleoside hydrolase [Candidatus Limnocylindrales bacterium]
MPRPAWRLAPLLLGLALAGCSNAGPTGPVPSGPVATGTPGTAPATTEPGATTAPASWVSIPAARTMLFDTDVAPDDLVALAFLLRAPGVDIAAITVSGTGEAHCPDGVDVVLRVLERLSAPDIPVACGRATPLAGSHTFPDVWREGVDQGSQLNLPSTDRTAADSTAVELIARLAAEDPELVLLATGPLTNLADALLAHPAVGEQLKSVFVMGGALHVPGNLVCCGAPEDNDVAEWNIYVDPRAAQVVVDSGLRPFFVSLDATNQVPLTPAFAARAMERTDSPAATLVAELFAANPFMTDGASFLWDPLAAELAAGYPVGAFAAAAIDIEVAEGPESGFTRPTSGEPNIEYVTTVDRAAAEDTLLGVLNGG